LGPQLEGARLDTIRQLQDEAPVYGNDYLTRVAVRMAAALDPSGCAMHVEDAFDLEWDVEASPSIALSMPRGSTACGISIYRTSAKPI